MEGEGEEMVDGDEDSRRCTRSLRKLDSNVAALLVPSPGSNDQVISHDHDDKFQRLQL